MRRIVFKGDFPSLDGLTTLDADTAKALAEFKVGCVNLSEKVVADWLAKNPLTPKSAPISAAVTNGNLDMITALESPDSVASAKALATRKGPLSLPNLKKISPRTLTALTEKGDIEIPWIETLELIPEPDGSVTDDFVIPQGFKQRSR